MGSARDAILEALENLTADELKKFKMKLLSVPLPEGYGRIPRGTLFPMDAVDLTDKLVSFYLEPLATKLTEVVLGEIGMQETAAQLQKISNRSQAAYAASAALASAAPSARVQMAANPGLHFVDQHRAALIARVTAVDAVLDVLHSKVLTEEQYQAVQAEATNQMKMRKLFSFVPAWNPACKNLLLQALRDTQPFLVSDLERN